MGLPCQQLRQRQSAALFHAGAQALHQPFHGVSHAVVLSAGKNVSVHQPEQRVLERGGERSCLVHIGGYIQIHNRAERLHKVVRQIVLVQLAAMVQPLPRQKPVNCGAAGGIAAQNGIAVIERGVAAIVGAAGKACAEQGGEVIRGGGCLQIVLIAACHGACAGMQKGRFLCFAAQRQTFRLVADFGGDELLPEAFFGGQRQRKLRACRGKLAAVLRVWQQHAAG